MFWVLSPFVHTVPSSDFVQSNFTWYSVYTLINPYQTNMEEHNQHEQTTVSSTEPVVATPTISVSTEEATDTVVTTAPETAPRNKNLMIAIAIVVLAALGAGGYYFYKTKIQGQGPVAVVNGVAIDRKDFNDSLAMLTASAAQQGADVIDPKIKSAIESQTLDTLVNNALLVGGAKAAGFAADQATIDADYKALVDQLGGTDGLKAQMEKVGLTDAKLRSNIADRVVVDAFLNAKTDLKTATTTNDEVLTFYNTLKAQSTTTPPLADIQPMIEQQLLGQKQQTIVNDFIKTLHDAAKIQINI